MIKKILYFLINKELKKNKGVGFSFENLHSASIIIDKNYNFLKELKSVFREKNIKVFFITSNIKNEIIGSNDYNYTKKDLNVFGLPKKEFKTFLENINTDITISFLENKTPTQDYIISKIKSSIKIGIEENDVYDIVIKNNNDNFNKKIIDIVFSYLKNIKK